MLRLGYNSNGFGDHTLQQMVQVLRRFGYEGIGLTLAPVHLDPFSPRARWREAGRRLEAAGLEPVVETGARYLLDPFRKHRPSLVSVDPEGRRQRLAFYLRAVDIAAEIGARVVSIWSGTPQRGVAAAVSWARLEESLPELLDHAARRGIQIGFEPEPGMFVEDLAGYAELRKRLPHPALKLTLDLGHLAITEEPPFEPIIRKWGSELVNVHVEDIRDRRHEHLPLGEGELDFPPLLGALREIGYSGLVQVELSRHSHAASLQAQKSVVFLRRAEAVALARAAKEERGADS